MPVKSPAKFNPDQQEWFRRFYNCFVETERWPETLDGEDIKSQQLRHKVAKNLASAAVFELNGLAGEH